MILLKKKRVRNGGQGDQYYFEKNHPAIISDELWEKVNRIYQVKVEEARRFPQCQGEIFVGKFAMSGKLKCGCCGTILSRRTQMKTTSISKNVWKCRKSVKKGHKFCGNSKSIDEDALQKGFVQALNMLLLCEENVLSSFIKTLESADAIDEERNNINRITSEIKTLELRKSRALDAMIDGSITKDQYNSKVKEINDMLLKLNEELVTSEAISKKKNTIKEKLAEFSQMIEKGTKFEEYDGDVFELKAYNNKGEEVFEAVIHKVIVGGDDANGNFDPYQITYVFNLVGTGYSATDNYVVVGNFDCDYKYYTFDYDPIVQMKVKKLKLSIPCRIALKLE